MSGGGNGYKYGVIYYERTWGDMDTWLFDNEKEARDSVAELQKDNQSYLLILPDLTVDKSQKLPGMYTQAELDHAVNQEAMASQESGRQEAAYHFRDFAQTAFHYRDQLPEPVLKRLIKLQAYFDGKESLEGEP